MNIDYSAILWVNIFSKMIFLLLLIGLFSSIIRTDLIGIIIPLSIYIIHSTTFNRESLKYINKYIFAIGGNLAYDFIWILINKKVKN